MKSSQKKPFLAPAVCPHAQGSAETGRWYDVKVQIQGRRIQCFLDGQLVHEVSASAPDRFFAEAGRDDQSGEMVLKAINVSKSAVSGQINLNSGAEITGPGTLITLCSDQLSDNNSFDKPSRVVPATGRLDVPGGSHFSYQFPPNSLTIIRVPIR